MTLMSRDEGVPAGATVHHRFRSMARQHAGQIAVVAPDGVMTYHALDRESDRVASALMQRGIGPGAVVGMLCERSAFAIVTLLGVLKSGAAYLPLDPSWPEARMQHVASLARVAAVIVQDGLTLPAGVDARVIDASGPGTTDASRAGDDTQPRDTAYVMLTSGSTGVPKGVAVPHQGILRLVCHSSFMDFDAPRMLHAAPLCFDASTLEIFAPLLNGGTCIVHPERIPTAERLGETIRRHRVQAAWLTAALFNQVVDQDATLLAPLRWLLTGGEALSVPHVMRALRAMPETQLVNGYGPTECTTFATTYAIPRDFQPGDGGVPIGAAIGETSLHVLDAQGQPVAEGTAGELYIGGQGVALGYLHQPELTAQRFVPSPHGTLYRTGDLVRQRDDGHLLFVGRVDDQVKIHGYRIEPGEVEHAVRALPGIADAVVMARRQDDQEPQLVAYYVSAAGPVGVDSLRDALSSVLPPYMLPARWVGMAALPVTANGKVDRAALPAPGRDRPTLAVPFEAPRAGAERLVASLFERLLDVHPVGRHDNFFALGGDSLAAVQLAAAVSDALDIALDAAQFLDHPTPAAVAGRHAGAAPAAAPIVRRPHVPGRGPVAIVAMAGRFPGAPTVEAFWSHLLEGRESVRFFADDELDASVPDEVRGDPAYVRARGIIDDAAMFDAGFFGMTAREAALTDPQQRVFLELCWSCLERGGYVPDDPGAVVGIYAGMHNGTYYQHHLADKPALVDAVGAFQVMLGNEKDYLATRVAHHLDLTGPAVSVNTACSTSLVAIAQAVDALRAGRCDMALAGGVAIQCPMQVGYVAQEGSMLSPDGHTRTFDQQAAGTVFSDGAGVVLLKRLEDAERDGDAIVAVIRGVAINNDGARKASFTAPNASGQAAVIQAALKDAGVTADDVGYVEAHGTATPLGDPVELAGLTAAFRQDTDRVGYCRLGSLKSNVGHMTIAAGVAGVIKTALSLQQRVLPPTVHFTQPNPALRLDTSPFVVSAQCTAWPDDAPALAGVSSFGVGGTNAHVVLEPPPRATPPEHVEGPHLLTLSARTPEALRSLAAELSTHVQADPSVCLADVAWTLATGRKAFPLRASVVASDATAAANRLRDLAGSATCGAAAKDLPVAFLFPGQGSHYLGMGQALYAQHAAFRNAWDEAAAALAQVPETPYLHDLKHVAWTDPDAMAQTACAQPAIFAIEYALARLWQAAGVIPTRLLGHSIGEFAAAVVADVMSLQDAARLVARRGQLMQAMPHGSMLSVRLAPDDVRARLPRGLDIAAHNAPSATVVAGAPDAVAAFQRALDAEGVASRMLATSHAFHSAMMDGVVAPFRDEVAAMQLQAPVIPIVSTATGLPLTDAEATSPDYWAGHLRQPVKFSAALERLLSDGPHALLEVGPRATLTPLARQHRTVAGSVMVASLGDHVDDERHACLHAMGVAWSHGVPVRVDALDVRQRRQRTRLPTYPFARERHWVDATPAKAPIAGAALADTPPPADAAGLAAPPSSGMGDDIPQRLAALRALFEDTCGCDLADTDDTASFVELGLDSLALTQVALRLQKTYGVRIAFRELMDGCHSMALLAQRLDTHGSVGTSPATATVAADDEAAQLAHTTYDVRKAFGAIARIHAGQIDLSTRQRARLDAFMRRYVERTAASKAYTAQHRDHLADPRVVNGFRPLLKDIIYPIVVQRSEGPRVWDLDGNAYVDALNGFGMNLFGWQPRFVLDAVRAQLEAGYEIGPQHPLAGVVARQVCDLTGFDRAALCNTGSEAVMGCIRVARTVTGRDTLVVFNGAYHGIFDEVIVRGTRSLKSVPAAPGILPDTARNVIVLDYGTPESLQVIRERAHEIAAVLVEPVQSRRPDFQPVDFLRELRTITADSGTLLVFDEVVTGFRAHPRGAQAVLGIDADMASYGKVVGGGFPIGVIAGKRAFMDALDGGDWRYGDDSVPTVGVTYFAGTFVRHPLALAAAHAVLNHLADEGPALQQKLNARVTAMADDLNAFCASVGAPLKIVHFASVWKTQFTEEHPLQDLLFAMMRSRGIHILDNFPCFFTTAHAEADVAAIAGAFRESVLEMQEAGFLPRRHAAAARVPAVPPVPGARLGKTPEGTPAWFVPDPEAPGTYLKVTA